MFAVSPTLLLSGLVNWDMLAVTCVAGALWAWSRDRPVLTGALIGLGIATKLYPLFLLGGILVICLRNRRLREAGQAYAAAAVTWLLVNAPAYVAGPEDWKTFWRFNSDRAADLGSVWLVLDQRFDWSTTADTINLWSWLVFGAWCIGVLVLGLTAPASPRLAQLGFLVVAGFLLVNKVYSPQYVLWLLPLAVLARPRLRDQLIWQGDRGLLLRLRVVVPRQLPGARRRRRRGVLLVRDPAPDGRRALPGGRRGPRHLVAQPRPGPPEPPIGGRGARSASDEPRNHCSTWSRSVSRLASSHLDHRRA